MMEWFWYHYPTQKWWVSMFVYGWDGGEHVMDDFGNLVPV